MEKKYKFVEPTPEEQKAFNDDLSDLAKKYSFNLEIVPQFKANQETKAYEVTGILLLQKIVEDTEPTVSPLSEEMTANEPGKEA